jgi:hypothetical protein
VIKVFKCDARFHPFDCMSDIILKVFEAVSLQLILNHNSISDDPKLQSFQQFPFIYPDTSNLKSLFRLMMRCMMMLGLLSYFIHVSDVGLPENCWFILFAVRYVMLMLMMLFFLLFKLSSKCVVRVTLDVFHKIVDQFMQTDTNSFRLCFLFNGWMQSYVKTEYYSTQN